MFNAKVTKKEIVDAVQSEDPEPVLQRGVIIRRWYLYLDDEEFEVEMNVYEKFNLGQEITVHVSQRAFLLKVEPFVA